MKTALSIVLALTTTPAFAQTFLPAPSVQEGQAPRPARGKGVSAALAVEAAQVAVQNCAGQGLKVTALVVDAEAVPIAMISGDGAAAITQRIASGKAVMAVKTKLPTGEAVARARTDAAFMTSLTSDPAMGPPRPGGVPIMNGGELIGAIAVSGAPSGAVDETCARAGLSAIQGRL
jgi:uncharacterized protein GlcG (DUF336 family)